MRRRLIGLSIAAMAAASLVSMAGPPERNALRPDAPRISNEQCRKRGKNKKGPAPNGLTARSFDKSLLICDRSSSFKKLRRWSRGAPDQIKQPDLKAKMRHAWFRNQLAREARAAA
jgi:hypothetical protein